MKCYVLRGLRLLFLQLLLLGVRSWQEIHDDVGVRLQIDSDEDEAAYIEDFQAKHPHIAAHIQRVIDSALNKHEQDTRRRLALENGLSDADKLGLLNIHNKYRNITAKGNTPNHPSATNIEKMKWDDAVASVAQGWAENCYWGHNGARGSDFDAVKEDAWFEVTNTALGENLYVTSAQYSHSKLLNGVTAFYNEYSGYDYYTRACSISMCGHYTQLVWDNSRYLGCGAAVCNPMDGLNWNNALFLVCNYHRPGNYPRQPYTSGDECDDCPVDRIRCEDGMCGGCPSKYYYTCDYGAEEVDSECDGKKSCDGGNGNGDEDSLGAGATAGLVLGLIAFAVLLGVGLYYWDQRNQRGSGSANAAKRSSNGWSIFKAQPKANAIVPMDEAPRSAPPRPSPAHRTPPPRLGATSGGRVAELTSLWETSSAQ